MEEFNNNAQAQNARVPQMPPKTWLVESILVTLFCCLPFGVVGIVFASKVESLFYSGQLDAAEEASRNAGKWTKLGFWIGLALGLLGIIFYAAVFIFAMASEGSSNILNA